MKKNGLMRIVEKCLALESRAFKETYKKNCAIRKVKLLICTGGPTQVFLEFWWRHNIFISKMLFKVLKRTQQLGNLATWKFGNLETWKLGNLKTWKLENLEF